MKKEYYTTFEVAQMCHVSPASVTRWIHEGKLKTSFTAGGHHRIQSADLVELLKLLNMPVPKILEQSGRTVVLIVDDEPAIREFVKAILDRYFKGIVIEEAGDGFVAGTKLTALLPDVVILDIMLPGLDGYKVCQFIREGSEFKHTKVIAITGRDEHEIKEKILSLGANEFLHKPFSIEQMKDKLVHMSEALKSKLIEPPTGPGGSK